MWMLLGLAPGWAAPPGDEATWTVLRDDAVRVECTQVGADPWCRSTGVVTAPTERVATTLENMAAHQDRFELVSSIRVIEPDTLHVTLDYPGLLSDRDYVAKYTRSRKGDVREYAWRAVERADVPPVEGVVRLRRFGGLWRLTPKGEHTEVTYVWHADPEGSFPRWALGIARRRTGHEALKDLAIANGGTLAH